MYLRKTGILLAILLLARGVVLPATAACPEAELLPHDGYLLRLTEDAPVPFSRELEYVAPGLYLTRDADWAAGMVDGGLAAYAEPNYRVSLFETQEEETTLPWAYQALHGSLAAERELTGAGVRIAIIDSGLQAENANLEGAVIAEGYDYVKDVTAMTDPKGHGTYVAQMIAGDGDDGMMRGIAPGAELVPLRCFDDSGSCNLDDLIRAVTDAANPEKFDCDIINMSWGMTFESAELTKALQTACDAGVISVASAGNVQSNMPQGTLIYPAALDTVLGVASVDADRIVAASSQQTAAVDVCAPGKGIAACSGSGAAVSISGTSFAAPCAAAVLALLRQAAPEMTPAFAGGLLRSAAEDLGDLGRDNAYGCGFVDLEELLSPAGQYVASCGAGIGCWLPESEARLVCAALYNETGRMTASRTVTLSAQKLWAFCAPETDSTACRMKVFFLTQPYVPCRLAAEREPASPISTS